VNEVLGDHNVDKQMTDSRGEVAYLMADVSHVNAAEIKDLYQNLEDLSCKSLDVRDALNNLTDASTARIRTRILY
jgi:hypothetical protein